MANIDPKTTKAGSKGVKDSSVDRAVSAPNIKVNTPDIDLNFGSETSAQPVGSAGGTGRANRSDAVVFRDEPSAERNPETVSRGYASGLTSMDFSSLSRKPVTVGAPATSGDQPADTDRNSGSGKPDPTQTVVENITGVPAGKKPKTPGSTQMPDVQDPTGGDERPDLYETSIDDGGLGASGEAAALQAAANAKSRKRSVGNGRSQSPEGKDTAGREQPTASADRAEDRAKTEPTSKPGADGEVPIFSDVFDRVKAGKVVAFTGHRPVDTKSGKEMLPGGYRESGEAFNRMRSALRDAIQYAYDNGARTFVTGMAIGADVIAADLVLDMKDEFPDIVLVGAVPHPGQERRWPESSKMRWNRILDSIPWGYVTPTDPGSNYQESFNRRNGAMVDRADLVIALFDGSPSGTAEAVRRAIKSGKPVIRIEPMTARTTVLADGGEKLFTPPGAAGQTEPATESTEADSPSVDPLFVSQDEADFAEEEASAPGPSREASPQSGESPFVDEAFVGQDAADPAEEPQSVDEDFVGYDEVDPTTRPFSGRPSSTSFDQQYSRERTQQNREQYQSRTPEEQAKHNRQARAKKLVEDLTQNTKILPELIRTNPAVRIAAVDKAVRDYFKLLDEFGIYGIETNPEWKRDIKVAQEIFADAGATKRLMLKITERSWALLEGLFSSADEFRMNSGNDSVLQYLMFKEMLTPRDGKFWESPWAIRVALAAMEETGESLLSAKSINDIWESVTNSIDADRIVATVVRNDRNFYRTHGEKGTQDPKDDKDLLRPRRWDKFITRAREIVNDIASGRIKMTGDHEETRRRYHLASNGETVEEYVTVMSRSQVVYDGVSAFLKKIGAGDIDPNDHDRLDMYMETISAGVMMYRGISTDMNRLLFGKKTNEGGKLSDAYYVGTLREMAENAELYNNVFAFRPDSMLGSTRAFSLPITREVAEFFAKFEGSNPTGASVETYMDYTVSQFNSKVAPLLEEDAIDLEDNSQKMVINMLVHAITLMQPEIAGYGRPDNETEAGRPTIPIISPESFETLSEMYDMTSLYTRSKRGTAELLNSSDDTRNRIIASSDQINRTRRRWNKRSTSSKLFERVMESLNNIAVANQIFLLGQGGTTASGAAERGDNLLRSEVHVRARQGMAEKRLGVSVKPTDGMLEKIAGEKPLAAIDDALKFLSSVDSTFLLTMAAQNKSIRFGEGAFDQVNESRKRVMREGSEDEKARLAAENIVSKVASFSDGSVDFALNFLAAADFLGKKTFARLWLKYFTLEHAEAAEQGRPSLTPEEIERMYDSNADDFFRAAFGSIEGQQAMVKAMHGMLNGYNYATYKIGKALEDPSTRFLVGFVTTHFHKFQTNSFLRVTPGSTTAMFLAKYGVNRRYYAANADGSEDAQSMTEGWISATNQMQFGGDHLNADRIDYSKKYKDMTEAEKKAFKAGLNECLFVDTVNGIVSGTYVATMVGILLLAGIEPPDDERLLYDYTEWKVGTNIKDGGWTISMSWVLDDLSRGMMPAVFGIVASIWLHENRNMSASEAATAGINVFSSGTMDVLGKNRWVQLMGITDAAKSIIGAEDHRATVSEEIEFTETERLVSELEMFLLRRTTAVFEPAVLREIYSGRGLFAPDSQYDVSTSQIYTLDPTDDEDKTVATTYRDSRLRKETKRSWLAGTVANFFTQVDGDNTEQRTGYLRGDMPTLMNADPVHLMWSDKLTPKGPGDIPLDFEPTSDESIAAYAPIAEELRKIIENPKYTPQILAASGLMIPYNARKALSFQYDLEIELMWREYYARKAAGDWTNHGEYGSPEHIRLAQEQNRAYESIQRRESEVYNLKQKLWSNTIPYSPRKLVRGLTDFRTVKVWGKGSPKEGQPVGALEGLDPRNRDLIETRLYPVGNVRSAWKPFTAVRDPGDPSYDYRTKLGWNSEMTDEEFVKKTTSGYIAVSGVGKGEDMFELVTGDGATGPGASKKGNWNSDEFLFMLRGYFDLEPVYEENDMPEFDWDEILGKDPNEDKDDSGKADVPSGSSWGSGGGWSYGKARWTESLQNIYSHAGGNLNYDRPTMMRSKTPNYIRFDYLRPSVETKGSRQAYRREDI